MDIIVTPIVKNKSADLTDKNNDRAFAVSNVDTMILRELLSLKL